MKKILLLLLSALTIQAYSQCNNYYNFREGAEYEVSHYTEKGKMTGKSISQVLSVEESGSVFKALIRGKYFDEKGKELTSNDFEYICEDGILKMDMSQFVPEELYKDTGINFEMEGAYLEIPDNLEVGQSLKDGMIEGKMEMEGNPAMAAMTMTIRILNRKVDSKESITTEAGTFSCFKISYNLESTTKVMGINTNVNLKGIDYMAEGIGVVKTEAYNKKGNLTGYSLLTAYK